VKTLLQQPKYIPTLHKLGDDWDISEELVDDLDSFTCSMYRQTAKVSKVNDLRLIRINELCTKQNCPVLLEMLISTNCLHVEEVCHNTSGEQTIKWAFGNGLIFLNLPSPRQARAMAGKKRGRMHGSPVV